MMLTVDDFPALLGPLYAAPLEPEKWQVFFDALSGAVRVSFGALMAMGTDGGPTPLACGGFAFDPDIPRIYAEHYAGIDPFAEPVTRHSRVAVIEGEAMVSMDRLRKSELYDGLLRKYEMGTTTLLSFAPTAEGGDVLTLWRRPQDGPMEREELRLLESLLPHAHTALRVRRELEAAQARSLMAELALETMTAAVFLVAANGRVVHMNRLGSELVDRGDGLRLEGTLLAAHGAEATERMRAIIAEASQPFGKASGGALPAERRNGARPVHVSVLPLPESYRRMVAGAYALVFATDPDATPRSRATTLRAIYGLTPTEARLADLLGSGLDVREAGDRMRITLETARSNLKRVLAKTGTHRQAELMRLMLSLPGMP